MLASSKRECKWEAERPVSGAAGSRSDAGGRVARERGWLSRLFSRPPSEPDVRLSPHPALQFPMFLACGLSFAPVLDAGEERVGSPPLAYLDVLASRKPASLCRWAALRPV